MTPEDSRDPPQPRLRAVHRHRVTPDDVGSRVTIRRLVDDDQRGQVASDVVGLLQSFEADHLVVVRRDGTAVEVDARRVVASRVIPEAPPRRP